LPSSINLIEEFVRLIGDVIRALEEGKQTTTINGLMGQTNFRISYGLSVGIGLSKMTSPQRELFDKSLPGSTEPYIDIIDQGKYLTLIALVPGIRKQDVDILLDKETITISVNEGTRMLRWEIPSGARIRLVSATCKNGVLQVVLGKWRRRS